MEMSKTGLVIFHGKVWVSSRKSMFIFHPTGDLFKEIKLDKNVSCLCAFDGFVWSSGTDGTVSVWDKEGSCNKTFTLPVIPVVNVECMASDGAALVAGCWDEVILLWKTANEEPIRINPNHTSSDTIHCIALFGGCIWVANTSDVMRWTTDGISSTVWRGYRQCVNCMQVFGGQLWISGRDRHIRTWDSEGNCLRDIKLLKGEVNCFAVNGSTSIWSLHTSGDACCWSTNGRLVKTVMTEKGPISASGAREGYLWIGLPAKLIKIPIEVSSFILMSSELLLQSGQVVTLMEQVLNYITSHRQLFPYEQLSHILPSILLELLSKTSTAAVNWKPSAAPKSEQKERKLPFCLVEQQQGEMYMFFLLLPLSLLIFLIGHWCGGANEFYFGEGKQIFAHRINQWLFLLHHLPHMRKLILNPQFDFLSTNSKCSAVHCIYFISVRFAAFLIACCLRLMQRPSV